MPQDNAELKALVKQARAELSLKTSSHDAAWGLSKASWSADLDAGTIEFSQNKKFVATCTIQVIGSFNEDDKTWLWSWDNASVKASLQKHAKIVKAFGAKHKSPRLTTRKVKCTKKECWDFAALACKLNDAQGAYVGVSGSALVFMTFDSVTLTQDGDTGSKGSGTSLPVDAAFAKSVEKAKAELSTKLSALDWDISTADYAIDHNSGTVEFSRDFKPVATASIQQIGFYDLNRKTWRWGWDVVGNKPAQLQHLNVFKAHLSKYPKLLKYDLKCSFDDCWGFAALAAQLNGAQGAFYNDGSGIDRFMTFSNTVPTKKAKPGKKSAKPVDASKLPKFLGKERSSRPIVKFSGKTEGDAAQVLMRFIREIRECEYQSLVEMEMADEGKLPGHKADAMVKERQLAVLRKHCFFKGVPKRIKNGVSYGVSSENDVVIKVVDQQPTTATIITEEGSSEINSTYKYALVLKDGQWKLLDEKKWLESPKKWTTLEL